MLRRSVRVVALTLGLVVSASGVAQAGGWDLIHERSGHGRVTLRAWTRGYAQVAFISDHVGTRISVAITVDCRNGDHFEDTWTDGGRRFRFVLRGLNNSGRCNHVFRVDANDSFPTVFLSVFARG